MAITKEKKAELFEQFGSRFGAADAAIVAEYAGVTANELAELRVELRKVGTEFRIVKNRIAKKAIESQVPGSAEIKDHLKGPIGVAYIQGDVAAGAKKILEFSKKNEKFKVTGGLLDGKSLNAADVKAISDLPSKEELLAKIVGCLVSPHRGLLFALNGVSGNVVRTIAAIRDTKSE